MSGASRVESNDADLKLKESLKVWKSNKKGLNIMSLIMLLIELFKSLTDDEESAAVKPKPKVKK
jgi:hypothetical protein